MSYTGREALQAVAGITKDDFEVIAWLTGGFSNCINIWLKAAAAAPAAAAACAVLSLKPSAVHQATRCASDVAYSPDAEYHTGTFLEPRPTGLCVYVCADSRLGPVWA